MDVYIKLYKPYGYLSQFTQEVEGQKTLKDLVPDLSDDIYPIGRLDKDSEGLLLLTNNRSITQELLHPSKQHERTYWVQVDGAITDQAINQLKSGVHFRAKKKAHFSKMQSVIPIEPSVPDRDPPIRYRAKIPTSWVSATLMEGKNRQVRRMFAAVEFPVLRLIRHSISNINIDGMQIGDYEIIESNTVKTLLNIP